METRGLVARTECPEDGRGSFVGVTPDGRRAIEDAAPGHVRAVREYFLDPIGSDGLEALAGTLPKLP